MIVIVELDHIQIIRDLSDSFDAIPFTDKINLLSSTKKKDVLAIENRFIIKIAKSIEYGELLLQERHFLLQFNGNIAEINIPNPKWFAKLPSAPFGVMAYRKIEGNNLQPDALDNMTQLQRENYVTKLAHFLVTLHDLDINQEHLNTQFFPPPQQIFELKFGKIKGWLHQNFTNKDVNRIIEFKNQALYYLKHHYFDPVVIHGDLTMENQILTITLELNGIVGFSDLSLGNPLVDISLLTLISEEFRDEVFEKYIQYSGTNIDFDLNDYSYFILGLRSLLTIAEEIDNNCTLQKISEIENLILKSNHLN